MASGHHGDAARQINRLFRIGAVGGLTDGQLLERFATRRGEAAESAFEALVTRHGPMVLRVCRGLLRDPHDVDDAFQATFLVLVRKAGSIGERDLLGPWLHGVARRVALKARSVAARRGRREGGIADDPPADEADAAWLDLRPVLHEEVDRLPEKYRKPVVLCHFQGMTHAEAAQELAWPVGTVSVRLARARKLLRERLTRRGLTATASLWGAGLAADAASAAVPESLIRSTTMAARSFAAGKAVAAGVVPAGAIALAKGVLMMMLVSRLKWVAAPVLVGACAAGAVVLAQGTPSGPVADRPAVKDQKPPETPPTRSDTFVVLPAPIHPPFDRGGRPSPEGPVVRPDPGPGNKGGIEAVPPVVRAGNSFKIDPIPPSFFDLQAPANKGGAGSPLAPRAVMPGQRIVVEVLEALPGRPITGERIVGPDGTITLGFYGDLYVDGLTRTQIKVKVIEHMRKYLTDEALGLITSDPAEGKMKAVPPAESTRVFVDDTIDLPRARAVKANPGAENEGLRDRVVELDAKLDRVLRELRDLRRQLRQPEPRDAGKVQPF